MTNDLPALPDPGLRVSGAERQKAIAVLREAAADERITFDELEARLPGALQAKDRSALYRILGDLVPAARLGTMFDGAVVESDAPGMSWEHPLLIETDWKGFTQDGLWEVPPFLEVLGSGYGTVTLDLTRATPLAPVIDIVLTGNPVVKILVPEGWGGPIYSSSTSCSKATRALVPGRRFLRARRKASRGSSFGVPLPGT